MPARSFTFENFVENCREKLLRVRCFSLSLNVKFFKRLFQRTKDCRSCKKTTTNRDRICEDCNKVVHAILLKALSPETFSKRLQREHNERRKSSQHTINNSQTETQ